MSESSVPANMINELSPLIKMCRPNRPVDQEKWAEKRERVISEQNGKCATCGSTGVRLQVHHNTYERYGNEDRSDLVALCVPCHDLITGAVMARRDYNLSGKRYALTDTATVKIERAAPANQEPAEMKADESKIVKIEKFPKKKEVSLSEMIG